jgi:hypothetical protein
MSEDSDISDGLRDFFFFFFSQFFFFFLARSCSAVREAEEVERVRVADDGGPEPMDVEDEGLFSQPGGESASFFAPFSQPGADDEAAPGDRMYDDDDDDDDEMPFEDIRPGFDPPPPRAPPRAADDDGGARNSPPRASQQQHQPGASQEDQAYIWGTTVSLESCKMRFKKFVEGFSVGNVRRYMDLLEQVDLTGNTSFALDCNHLAHFDMDLYRDLVRYPQEVIPIFDMALDEMFRAMLDASNKIYDLEEQIKVRPFRLLHRRPMRELNPSDMNSLVSIQGMVTRASHCIPDLKQAFYQVGKFALFFASVSNEKL